MFHTFEEDKSTMLTFNIPVTTKQKLISKTTKGNTIQIQSANPFTASALAVNLLLVDSRSI